MVTRIDQRHDFDYLTGERLAGQLLDAGAKSARVIVDGHGFVVIVAIGTTGEILTLRRFCEVVDFVVSAL